MSASGTDSKMMTKQIASLLAALTLFTAGGLCATIPANAELPPAPKCKAIPGGDGWPSLETWASFNQSIDGRLIKPTPPGAVCHPGHAAYDSSKCQIVQTAWSGEPLHSNDPVSVMWNNWNNDTCLPDPRLSCSEAGYAVYVVNATTPEHVKAGIDFARQHNIRLIVKNSGHDYIGRSTAPNSLSIWVHHMKSFKAHETSFQPAGCNFSIPGHGITAGAGTQMQEAYRATALLNRTVVGGNGRTVALGGFITGGGHSILAPHYGMAADQVLQLELVTPRGEILTANECQNTDLFWAMRGGGGGTFGVLTSVTLQTIPSPQVSSLTFLLATPSTNPQAFDAVTYFLTQLPVLEAAGVSGYPIIFQNSTSSTNPGDPTLFTGVIGKLIMLNASSSQTILSHVNPIFAHINSAFPYFTFYADVKSYPSFGAWYEENYDPSPVGHSNVMGSRLLSAESLTANLTATKIAFEKFSSGGQATAYVVSGRGVWNAKPRGGSNGTAVNPAWRKGVVVHATASVFNFASADERARKEALKRTKGYADALREISPDLGAYVNEADRYEENWQETFWGGNYERLAGIKKVVDPQDVLWCGVCVGGEGWEEVEGGKLCRV
ncbi:Tetrahydrocannabinolic acid synthase, partial [Cladorrhinum sp. PSN332]